MKSCTHKLITYPILFIAPLMVTHKYSEKYDSIERFIQIIIVISLVRKNVYLIFSEFLLFGNNEEIKLYGCYEHELCVAVFTSI